MRHDLTDEPIARSYAVTHPTGSVHPYPADGWGLVVYATRGVLSLELAGTSYTIPPHRAALLPDGARATMRVVGRTSLRNLYVQSAWAVLTDRPRVVDVPPLARELLLAAVHRAPLRRADPRARRLLGTLIDELARLPQTPLQLPMPADPHVRALAEAVLATPGGPESIVALAQRAGLSRRTLERRFRAETGMAPAQWHRRARLIAAVRMLAEGHSAAATASAVGFATPSAFSAAFRRELGMPPSTLAVRGDDRRPPGPDAFG